MSGKTARRLRKSHFLSKKALAMGLGLCISSTPLLSESQLLISIYPHFSKPLGDAHSIQYGMGAGAKVTYRPVKFLNLFAQGDYYSMALPGIDPMTVLNGQVGTGYHLEITDRISLDLNINGGVYSAKSKSSLSGFTAGGALVFSYRFTPVLSGDVNASGTHFVAGKKPLMMLNAGLAPGVTFNITKLFDNEPKINARLNSLAPVFPVLYSWYENNSFGSVDITNNEDAAITNVTVSFFQPQYMAHAKECATIPKIKRDETVSVDLVAFFNEQMLELREKTDTNSIIIVEYSYLGQKRSQSFPLTVPVYGRNNMSWDDDRRAAVFVSSKDPAAMQFAKYTASIVRDNLRVDIPENIQYALGIFETLNQFGLNYVVDPSSAFEDNVGTSSIDFLQFPYQTIMYRGGDCDDISILVCSLFEAVGIETAFITIPGHIFMAFNAGITPDEAQQVFRNMSDFIVDGDEVWVPLEITLSDEGFYRACRVGAREWNNANANGAAALYKMRDNWKIYQPIAVPGANAFFSIPDGDTIALAFEQGADVWSRGELRNLLFDSAIQFVIKDTDDTEADTVIRDDPLEPGLLKDILALARNAVALAPVAIREEELERYDDEDDNDKPSEADESIDDLLPLDLAIATVQTDVPVRANFEEMVAEQSKLIPDPEPVEDEDEENDWVAPTKTSVTSSDEAPTPKPAVAKVVEPVETTGELEPQSQPVISTSSITPEDSTITPATAAPVVELATPVVEPVETTKQKSSEPVISTSSITSEEPEKKNNSATTAIAVTAVAATAIAGAGLLIIASKKRKDEGLE